MLIRYPGSKDKHLKHLLPQMKDWASICEPFAGTAAVTFALLRQGPLDRVVINDLDREMRTLWRVVYRSPEPLIRLVERYKPRAEDFYRIKATDPRRAGDEIHVAFEKIVIHQISYSGLGRKAGSPIGGRMQKKPDGAPSTYLVGCRWNSGRLARKIRECHDLLHRASSVVITDVDAGMYLLDPIPIYLDPPYNEAGPGLYHQDGRGHASPAFIDTMRQRTRLGYPWVMSYDPNLAADFREFADIRNLDVRSHLHHDMIRDVLVTPRQDAL